MWFWLVVVCCCAIQSQLLELQLEDNASIEKYLEEMKAECYKIRPNYDLLHDRQQRTLQERTEHLRSMETLEILIKYPWINMSRMVRFHVDILCLSCLNIGKWIQW